MALFNREEVMRPLTLAALIAIAVFVIILRVRGGAKMHDVNALTPESFGEIINSVYPTNEQLENTQLITITERERKSESIHMVSRDGFATQGYISKPAGNGPFPFITIVPDPFANVSAQTVSQTIGELYAVSLHAVVLVVDPRSTHRGVDDVTDTLAPIEWQDKVIEIHKQPQLVIGIGYGAWLVSKASETVQPKAVAYFSPILDLNSADVKASFRNLFISQSDCENVSAQEACLADLTKYTVPSVPTYIQTTSGEEDNRAADVAAIASALTTAPVEDQIDSTDSLRTLVGDSSVPVLAQSLSLFATWYDAQNVTVQSSNSNTKSAE